MVARRLLNVGGGSKAIAIPAHYDGWDHQLLDIDPIGAPDVVCDARELTSLAPSQFDAVYCSHNLEHYFHHDVPKVLAGFHHVLHGDGFAHIRVPDIGGVMRIVVEKGLDLVDVLYISPAGPVRVADVIYGFGAQIAASGNDYFAHKTGFTVKSLVTQLYASGFSCVYATSDTLEIVAVAGKNEHSDIFKAFLKAWAGPVKS